MRKTQPTRKGNTKMKVKSIEEAWKEANRFFPTDYIKNEAASANAGYPIYQSTSTNEEYRFAQIADLGCRLEVNDGIQTINIWIEDDEPKANTMTATVRSIAGEFPEYRVHNIISVQYIAGNLVLTYLVEGTVKTSTYNSNAVIVEIHY